VDFVGAAITRNRNRIDSINNNSNTGSNFVEMIIPLQLEEGSLSGMDGHKFHNRFQSRRRNGAIDFFLRLHTTFSTDPPYMTIGKKHHVELN